MYKAGCYYITVIEDTRIGKIIGAASLITELKFIHECGLRARLEDVVVNNTYRGKQLGKLYVYQYKIIFLLRPSAIQIIKSNIRLSKSCLLFINQ